MFFYFYIKIIYCKYKRQEPKQDRGNKQDIKKDDKFTSDNR